MSNKLTLNALSRKHSQLQEELIAIEQSRSTLLENLNAIETTIRLIEPEYNISAIKPKTTYSKRLFKHGEVSSLVGDFVRQSSGQFSCPEIVKTIIEDKAITPDDSQRKKLSLNVYNALKHLEKNQIVMQNGKDKSVGSALLWRKTI